MKTFDIYDNISSFLLRMRNVSDKVIKKTNILFSITLFQKFMHFTR